MVALGWKVRCQLWDVFASHVQNRKETRVITTDGNGKGETVLRVAKDQLEMEVLLNRWNV